jgi:hypothetical protein
MYRDISHARDGSKKAFSPPSELAENHRRCLIHSLTAGVDLLYWEQNAQ